MAEAIYLPKVGMTMEEGTLTKWVAADGAAVAKGEVLFEMETEKVQMEVESDFDGALKRLAAEGDVLKPGDIVGVVLAAGEGVPAALLERFAAQSGTAPGAGASPAPTQATEAVPSGAPGAVAGSAAPRVSPIARRLADENGIDVRELAGSGPDGRIVERDVQRAIEAKASNPPPAPSPLAERGLNATAAAPGGMLRVSPIARRLADENGIDVSTLAGSGPDGRIVERDVQRAIEARSTAAASPAATAIGQAPSSGGWSTVPVTMTSGEPVAEVGPASVAYTGRRRTIGERMSQSAHTVAPVTLHSETPVDEAMSMLHGLNREWRRQGVVVTLTALLVRAVAIALSEHPRFNARLDAGEIIMSSAVHVGVAVDIDAGLMVPVVRHAESRSLNNIAVLLRELTEKAKADSLTVDDLTGGTFTITSLEGSNVDAFTPIINPPQAAILGVGRVREVAAFDGPNVVRRQVTTLSLTFDHRIDDGGPAARFLDRIAELLSRPYLLM